MELLDDDDELSGGFFLRLSTDSDFMDTVDERPDIATLTTQKNNSQKNG